MFKLLVICLLNVLYVSALDAATSDLIKTNETSRYRHLQTVIEDLQSEEWQDDETTCVELLVKILKNVQNSTLWATLIWDSMQNPVGHLYGSRNNYGNYDECVEFPWEKIGSDMRTQYCLARIHLSEVDREYEKVDLFGNVNNYIRARTKNHLEFNFLNWGVCTPVACKPRSVVKFVGVLFRQSHLGLAVDNPNVTVGSCDIAGESKYKFDFGFYLTLSIIVLVMLWVLLSSWIVSTEGDYKDNDYLKAFDISTNARSLLTIGDNEIRCMFGIRLISCIILTGTHVIMLLRSRDVINALRVNKEFDLISLIFPLEMTADTFLFISGLLLVKSLLRNDSRIFNPLSVITKRFFRITLALGLVLLAVINLVQNIAQGPATQENFLDEISACNRNWWKNLLLIHNYSDTANMCHSMTWTVAVDFHLSVIGTFICWLFVKNKRVGVLVFWIGIIISMLAPAIFVYYQREIPLNLDFRFIRDYRTYLIANQLHTASHLRASAYFVGMAVGYLIFKYNPMAHRNIINKKYSIVGFCLFLTVFSSIFLAAHVMVNNGYTIVQAMLYASLKRVVWGTSIGLLIILCEYGSLPLITSFLSWTGWAPISKLSFGIYLLHGGIIIVPAAMARTPATYHLMGFIIDTCGIMGLSIWLSFVFWVFFNAPMNNIMTLILKPRKNKQGQESLGDEQNIYDSKDTTKKTR